MIGMLFLAVGLVLVVEGLVYALAPSLVEQFLTAFKEMPEGSRRVMGLVAMALGVFAIWIAKALGA
ncbi:DUF2065 domain-containing protein [Roseovarius sp. EL26]|uniref:DUF2065 domain-containing protein n=1 Tax=Roseovarius sp. EL26 TaxID=2126672 RepID=UPI0015753C13|nr:DUF2065 domain-containing protein [Roseovarius sp. EL26]